MVSDTIYDLCLPVLEDDSITEEDKTDKLEELIAKQASLSGKALEDAVLGVLWRHKGSDGGTNTSPQMVRATIIRRPSPAPWQQIQRSTTPISSSPRSISSHMTRPPGFGGAPPSFNRTKSSTASPYTSPRPSPRLAFVSPAIPHSPSLSAYQFSEPSPSTENYGDLGSDNVDWLVNDDASSQTSFGDSGFYQGPGSEYAAAQAQPFADMSPYDMLRSILRDDKSDEELEKVLEANGYDLSQTIMALTEAQGMDTQQQSQQQQQQKNTYLVGKSMSPTSRPITPAGQGKSSVVCRYWLSTGHCARADCRFSHDLTNHICKYWMMGNCLAGDSCIFSHDPSALMARMTVDGGATPPTQTTQPNFQLQDYDSFPALQPTNSNPFETTYDASALGSPPPQTSTLGTSPSTTGSALSPFGAPFIPTGPRNPTTSRPTSRPVSRTTLSATALSFTDDEAFPTLGSAAQARPTKRHHGKRGHGHSQKASPIPTPASLADVVRMTPSPAPGSSPTPRRTVRATTSRENSAAALAIPAPQHIPWLATGSAANAAYLKARAEAFKHGGLRNKFLQSAAQAWNRNDARGAKALSLRGQNENALMREAHREAARLLWGERNRGFGGGGGGGGGGGEVYVDLHGLHPEEAVEYLNECLTSRGSANTPIYAICGTGHHSKNGKDKVGKAVRAFLNDWRYAFREFSVPGDRNNVGGILGIDPGSFDREAGKGMAVEGETEGDGEDRSPSDSALGMGAESTKVRVVSEEEARGGRGG